MLYAGLAVLFCASSASARAHSVFVNTTVRRESHSSRSLLSEQASTPCEHACSAPGYESVCPSDTMCTSCSTESCTSAECQCSCECAAPASIFARLPLCFANNTAEPNNVTGTECEPAWNDTEAGGKYGLPDHGRVAVIVRGQAFRDGAYQGASCRPSMRAKQMEAVESLNQQVIGPLEARLNKIDVFVYENSNCGHAMMDDLIDQYNMGGRLKGLDIESRMNGQSFSMREAFNVFKRGIEDNKLVTTGAQGGKKETPAPLDPLDYDLIMVTRHDLVFRKPIETWKGATDFRRFNFLSRCAPGDTYGDACVSDLFYMMPGTAFKAFEESLGHEGCFSQYQSPIGDASTQHGFQCLYEIANRTKVDAAVITDWRPEYGKSFRTDLRNPIANLYTPDGL